MQNLLELDPDIFEASSTQEVSQEQLDEAEALLGDTIANDNNAVMEDFETENGTDGEKALDKLGSVRCEFDIKDIGFWFSEFEGQLEIIEIKSQWMKTKALQRFLPVEVKHEVKSLLMITKANAGTDLYKRIKKNWSISMDQSQRTLTTRPETE